ncbi:gamma-glutamylcyclotransferase [Defluviimonas sp. WL0024]|uniref:glutathione-specific gamma-glutamylcyclotransferase n=2 Tax=Albidovulum TaxID=205889 RepID=A0ABT3IZP4_9RHOB|nr:MULTISPECIES: gamma-glutamylcyclotransferase [Defluviimonas]MCU9849773.1 gamma-glutamylcyclotransferase [Defluviimonas sp. WL0024]MCW3780861.1 gamma-glutamylcyclotransferase [Defluviimonas salinarum]
MRALSLTEDHVARATRTVPESLSSTAFTRCNEDDFAVRSRRILESRPDGPLLVFAYGSLIWNPTFAARARHHAVARGWHRQFCIEIRGFRGTPDAPGLMMALMAGGRCSGVALEVPETDVEAVVDGLVRRETPFVENDPDWRWITVDTETGRARSLVFWAGPNGPSIRRSLPLDQVARQLARACGYRGSSAEYLRNTVLSLEEHGIRDRNLWTLQALVAAEIDRTYPAASG